MALQFDSIVFGPIRSRRLGSSLGVNLLPAHGKVCSFDCVYCECGWNADGRGDTRIPPLDEVLTALDEGISKCAAAGIPVDTITFSGNGEPTLHPDFAEIVDRTLSLRDLYFPRAKVSVLSNATQLHRPEVVAALKKVDNQILKIDSAVDEYAFLIDRPQDPRYSVARIAEQLAVFQGDFILQTMFLKGIVDGKPVDCTDPLMASAWQTLVLRLRPRCVMMYTLDRRTPLDTLEKVTVEEMEEIAAPLRDQGIEIQIKG